jgi:hypothetical protein
MVMMMVMEIDDTVAMRISSRAKGQQQQQQ